MDQPASPRLPSQPVPSPASIEELRQRPLFESPIDPKKHKLADVLTTYSFQRLAPCGLSTCKKGHLHGFHVVTASGTETNIGHVCGKREFGEDFVTASARYRRDEERRAALTRLAALQSDAPKVVQQVHGLIGQSFGVRWLFSVRDAVRARIGGPAFEHLKLRSFRQDYTATRVRELSEKEIQVAMERTRRKRDQVRYVTETLGRLAPMEWTHWDFHGQLLAGVRDGFRFLETLDPSQLQTKELRKHLKRVEGWEGRIWEAESVLTQTLRFLDRENLRVVDLALEEFRLAARSQAVPALVEWTASPEYATLLRGEFRDGQALG